MPSGSSDDKLRQIDEKINEKVKNIYKEKDTIRDKLYYEWIRNDICKNNISPNFVQSYCYFTDHETKIKFNKNSNNSNEIKEKNKIDKINENDVSQSLIILTESPENSIAYWCQNSSVKDRNVLRQVKVGLKSDKIWDSIIAQILLSFYVMLLKGFVIQNMDFHNSLYVKDVNIYNQSNKYWVYNYNNINYYVPNNGHLLMIDHNFAELILLTFELFISNFKFDYLEIFSHHKVYLSHFIIYY
jgi:hypothetical protein